MEFLIVAQSKETKNQLETVCDKYYLASPSIIDSMKILVGHKITRENKPRNVQQLPFWSSADVDPVVPRIRLCQLG